MPGFSSIQATVHWFEAFDVKDAGATTLAAESITIPLSTFGGSLEPNKQGLSSAEATGDIRIFARAFVEHLWDKWRAVATTDRPTKFKISKSASTDVINEVTTLQYVLTFVVATTGEEVVAE